MIIFSKICDEIVNETYQNYQELMNNPTAENLIVEDSKVSSIFRKPLSYYFKKLDCRYIIFFSYRTCESFFDDKQFLVQAIIAHDNIIDKCLENFIEIETNGHIPSPVFIATKDNVVHLSSKTTLNDFKVFNLSSDEEVIVRQKLFEMKLM